MHSHIRKMDAKNITLEMLVRSGNSKGVDQFAESEGIPDPLKAEKIAEAGLYSAVLFMWNQVETPDTGYKPVLKFLKNEKIKAYLEETQNTEILKQMLDAMIAGTHIMMEAYAQLDPIEILSDKSFSDAIRRNMDSPEIGSKINKLIDRGFFLLFSPQENEERFVKKYFPILYEWRDLVDVNEIAETAIDDMTSDSYESIYGNKDLKYKRDLVYSIIDSLIKLTDRGTVSGLMKKYLGSHKDYKQLIRYGKIDECKQTSKEKAAAFAEEHVEKYEDERFPDDNDVQELAERIGDKGKDLITQRIPFWFRNGKMDHLIEVAKFEEGRLYDHDSARKSLGKAIAEACRNNDYAKLARVLELPEFLIDMANPAINEVVMAYKISQETREKEE